jgi:predicted secreted protein
MVNINGFRVQKIFFFCTIFVPLHLHFKQLFMPALKLTVNEKKELRFAGLGTAGYMWKCNLDDDSKVKIERRMDNPPSGTNAVGASHDEIFTVTALKKGTVHASFIQYRHWEPESSAIKKMEYTIEIN